MKIAFQLNGKAVELDVAEDSKLLWVLREKLKLTGTKYGCGIALCGACTVHMNGKPIRSCVTPATTLEGKSITTIEGLSENKSHPLQKAWIDLQVPQCGYCQSGQIMQAAALLESNSNPTHAEIVNHMNGIICRCGTYYRMIKAIKKVSES